MTLKVTIILAPVALESLPKYNSRKFSTVQLIEVRAKIFPAELESQHLCLGFQPIMIITRSEPGDIVPEAVSYPTSFAIKEAAVMLLQSSKKPNDHLNASQWKTAIDSNAFHAEETPLLWPSPREEDDCATSDSAASVDTDGELLKLFIGKGKIYIYHWEF